jgi:hypothetical protein
MNAHARAAPPLPSQAIDALIKEVCERTGFSEAEIRAGARRGSEALGAARREIWGRENLDFDISTKALAREFGRDRKSIRYAVRRWFEETEGE